LKKKSSKKVENFLIFEKNPKSKIFENLENLENIFENFPLKIVLKIENSKISKFLKF
jgi:hypothetical protein